MDFDRCKECGKITITPRRWGETVICEKCYQESIKKGEREKEEKIRADERINTVLFVIDEFNRRTVCLGRATAKTYVIDTLLEILKELKEQK